MSLTHLTDFSDKLSPMLVKELRQGMRSKTFIAVFLSLQMFLAILLLSACMASSSDSIGSLVSGIIFAFFAIAVLMVQPLRGISALSSEMKANTLDMMVLTRLSASKIVLGKWVAIVSQSALLLSTIIPYLILRYFFGGMNLFGEMVLLGLLFLTSMALTAVTVGLSGASSTIIRSLIPVFALPVLIYSLLIMSFSRGGSQFIELFSLSDSSSRIGVATYVAAIVYIGVSMLSLGASLIAPAAENHSIGRRLFVLVALLTMLPLGYRGTIDKEWHAILVFVIAVPAIMIALTEFSPLVSTVCKPFIKRGRIGGVVGWLLYPCWSSGILYALVIGLLAVTVLFSNTTGDERAIVYLSLFGGLYFPAVWQVFLFRSHGQRLAHYLLILAGSMVMLGVLTAISNSMNNPHFLWFFAWNPLAFIAMLQTGGSSHGTLLAGATTVDLIFVLILVIRAFNDIRISAPVIQEAKDALANGASPVPSDPAP